MVCTPYAYTCAALENPELFVSYDGVIWDVPGGTINPLVPTPPNEGDHNSDPDMLFYEDQLWLYFRETRRATIPNENSIRLMKSSDGIKWSVPVEVLRDTSGSELLSPAVIHNGDSFAMWTVERLEGAFKITRRTSGDGANWSLPAICDTNGLASGRILWHIDVIREPDRLSALIVSVSSHGGAGARIHYGHSLDEGFSWIVGPFLFDQAYEFETKWQYRGTLLKVAADPHLYQLWYSAATEQSAWSIAYLKAIREGNSLRPHSFGIPAKA
jgi:hypothetical protein